MPRCGRRCLWPPAKLLPTAPTGPPPTSVRVSDTSISLIKCRNWEIYGRGDVALKTVFVPNGDSFFTLFTGYCEPSTAGCKQYSVGFTTLDDSSATATAEIAVNGMDPPEQSFSPAELTTETSGQSLAIVSKLLTDCNQGFIFFF